MRYIILISMMSFLFGCGPLVDLQKELCEMPDDIRPYYDEYFAIVGYNRQVAGQIMIKSPSKEVYDGECVDLGFYYQISIRASFWNEATDDQKRTMIFHELTHCTFLSVKHSLDPNSYMFAQHVKAFTSDELATQVISYIPTIDHSH